jgi:serine/threonine protein kinase
MLGIGSSAQLVRASRSTDMYAFAILAWELLTGQLPFHDCHNDSQLKHALGKNVRPDLAAISTLVSTRPSSASVPPAFRSMVEDLISKCWDSDRLQRKSSLECLILLQSIYQIINSKKYHIFISYSWKNQDFIEIIYYLLSKLGYYIWLDISSMGHSLQDSMKEGIANSSVILVFLSTGYLESTSCLFELKEAYQQKKKVLTVFLEPKEKLDSLLTKEIQTCCSLDCCLYLIFDQVFEDYLGFVKKSSDLSPSSDKRSMDSYYDHFAKGKALQSFDHLFRILRNCGILPTVFRATESENDKAEAESRPQSDTLRVTTILQNHYEDRITPIISDILKKYCEFRGDIVLVLTYLERNLVFNDLLALMNSDERCFQDFCETFIAASRLLPANEVKGAELMSRALFNNMKDFVPNRKMELELILTKLSAYSSRAMSREENVSLLATVSPNTMILTENSQLENREQTGKLRDYLPEKKVINRLFGFEFLYDSLFGRPQSKNLLPEVDSFKPLSPLFPTSVAPPLAPALTPALGHVPPKLLHQHIMLSYSGDYKKDRILALERKLKELGYDIWTVETGSSIVSSMSWGENPYDIHAQAVRNSALIIIFVSKAYFHSPNCKQEARYCSQKQKPLLFVMLDENYHTSSTPDRVEGWLGLLIGTQRWYPLWNLNKHLESTSSAIASTFLKRT